jgi:hypothetical protein
MVKKSVRNILITMEIEYGEVWMLRQSNQDHYPEDQSCLGSIRALPRLMYNYFKLKQIVDGNRVIMFIFIRSKRTDYSYA